MMKNRGRRILYAVLAGLFILTVQTGDVFDTACSPMDVYAAQTSDTGDSRLMDLDIAPGDLSPAFSPDVLEYTSSVDADVTSVSVRAVPRSTAGTIASVEGAKSLSPGVNTIKVTCSAQDFTYSVYTITLTVGSTGMHPEGEQPDGAQSGTDVQQPESTQPEEGEQPDSQAPEDGAGQADSDKNSGDTKKLSSYMGKVAKDGSVKLNGAAYQLSNNFSYGSITQDIPSAFGQGSLEIRGNTYSTLYCESSGVHLVYMENTDGSGSTGFYYYDEKQKAVERFKYAGTGDNFLVMISTAREELPDSYEETVLALPSGKEAAAYQNTASEDMQDYYLVYGIHSSGNGGWYLYDNAQATFMRYTQAFQPAQEEPEEEEVQERTISMEKYNLLFEKYTALRSNMVKAVSVLAVAIVILIIIFTAVILRIKDNTDGDQGDEPQERRRVSKRSKKTKKNTEAVSKSSLAAGRNLDGKRAKGEAKKITKSFTNEPQREAGQNSQVEELRVQRQREQAATEQAARRQMEEQAARRQMEEQAARRKREEQAARRQMEEQAARRQMTAEAGAGMRKDSSDTAQESVQMAAEKMRRSMQYSRKSQKTVPPSDDSAVRNTAAEHDPMDDWDMEDAAAGRKAHSHKKKRSLVDEDMEIMDLNDL